MQIEFLQANGSVWIVKRKFKADGWFADLLNNNIAPAEEICERYHVEKVLRSTDGMYYLVNEVSEAEIVND
jgi:hypothetical protein